VCGAKAAATVAGVTVRTVWRWLAWDIETETLNPESMFTLPDDHLGNADHDDIILPFEAEYAGICNQPVWAFRITTLRELGERSRFNKAMARLGLFSDEQRDDPYRRTPSDNGGLPHPPTRWGRKRKTAVEPYTPEQEHALYGWTDPDLPPLVRPVTSDHIPGVPDADDLAEGQRHLAELANTLLPDARKRRNPNPVAESEPGQSDSG
jgi:hypothetical protein